MRDTKYYSIILFSLESLKQLYFANELNTVIGIDTSLLLWMTDWPQYSIEQMQVFDTIRLAFGETRHLIESPGHYFEKVDSQHRTTFIFIMMAFCWHGYLIADDASLLIYIGDEGLWTYTSNLEKHYMVIRAAKNSSMKVHFDSVK